MLWLISRASAGVFDGHAGRSAASFSAQRLPVLLAAKLHKGIEPTVAYAFLLFTQCVAFLSHFSSYTACTRR